MSETFRWRVTVELHGWPGLWLPRGLRRRLGRHPKVLRVVHGWPLHMRLVRTQVEPHATIEVPAADQREAYLTAEAVFRDALDELGVDAEPRPWTLSTDWERA